MRCIPASALVAWLAAALLAPAPAARADTPAGASDAPRLRAAKSFDRFAEEWMAEARQLGERERRNPTAQRRGGAAVYTYRGYGPEHAVELRPTGHAKAPYVGLLRYVELVYRCASESGKNCSVASSVPVTEIFRYQDGRWAY